MTAALDKIEIPLRCDTHHDETLAHWELEEGLITIKDKRHGQQHQLTLSLSKLMRMLDPNGTSYKPVGTAI